MLADHGLKSSLSNWLSFDQAYTIYATTPGCMSGAAWYHWVAVRGVAGAESARPTLRRVTKAFFDAVAEQYNALGPFSCIWITKRGPFSGIWDRDRL